MFCDIHNHVLFGVDDGSQSLDESLAMLEQAVSAGIDTICATSHVHALISEKTRIDLLHKVYVQLSEEIARRNVPISLSPGCELYYTSEFSLVSGLPVFRYNKSSNFVLVELPPTEAPPWFADVCFNLKLNGVNVLLAHPERNEALRRNPSILSSYLQMGIYTQLTSGSLVGKYGQPIEAFARRILKSGACTVVASDAHNTSRRPFSDTSEAFLRVQDMVGTVIATKLFDKNPRTILAGGDLPASELSHDQEELLLKTEKRKKLFFLF